MEIKKRYYRRSVELTPSNKNDGWYDLYDLDGVYHGQIQFKF